MRGVVALVFVSACSLYFASANEVEAGVLSDLADAKVVLQLTDLSDPQAPVRSLRVVKAGGGAGSGMGGALVKMLLGWFLLPFSFALLMVNELNHARMTNLISCAKASVKDTPSTELDRQLAWELVSTNGMTATTSTLTDSDFVDNKKGKTETNPKVTDSVKLNRQLEIYQNYEDSKTEGEGDNKRTTYWIAQKWSSRFEASNSWQQEHKGQSNPPLPSYAEGDGMDKTWYPQKVDLGAYDVPKELLEKVDNWENMGEWNYMEQGRKEQDAQIGDVRVKWRKCPCAPTSIVAIQDDGNSFKPYRIISRMCMFGNKQREIEALRNAANLRDEDYEKTLACPIPGLCCLCDLASKFLHSFGKAEVYFIKAGVAQDSAASMEDISSQEGAMANIFRLVGWLLMFLSIMMISHPFVKLISYIPLLGPFFSSLIHMAIFWVALAATFLLSAVVICVAYVAVRPVFTLTIVAIVCAIVVLGDDYLPKPGPDARAIAAAAPGTVPGVGMTDAAAHLKLL